VCTPNIPQQEKESVYFTNSLFWAVSNVNTQWLRIILSPLQPSVAVTGQTTTNHPMRVTKFFPPYYFGIHINQFSHPEEHLTTTLHINPK
jgi:hypothetical protein